MQRRPRGQRVALIKQNCINLYITQLIVVFLTAGGWLIIATDFSYGESSLAEFMMHSKVSEGAAENVFPSRKRMDGHLLASRNTHIFVFWILLHFEVLLFQTEKVSTVTQIGTRYTN